VGHHNIKAKPIDPTACTKARRLGKENVVVGVLAPIYVRDTKYDRPIATLCWPNLHSYNNQLSSFLQRVAVAMPDIDGDEAVRFYDYAVAFVSKFEVATGKLRTFDECLDTSNYTSARKRQLRTEFARKATIDIDDLASESHVKAEGYPTVKWPRGINSPSDLSKTYIMPVQEKIDEATFKQRWFVKGTDPSTWPERMRSVLGRGRVVGTDFSSFEGHHRGVYTEVLLFWVRHMLSGIAVEADYLAVVERMMGGMSKLRYATVVCKIERRLMSGAQWTSSANGVLNLLIMSYLHAVSNKMFDKMTAREVGHHQYNHFDGFIEGDDGLFRDFEAPRETMVRMGLRLDFDHYVDFGRASFCGILCDVDTLVMLRDPVKTLRGMFWMTGSHMAVGWKRQQFLLRSRAISLLYLYPSCPIVSVICKHVCDRTALIPDSYVEKYLRVHFNAYEVEQLRRALVAKPWLRSVDITCETRATFEVQFGVSSAKQIALEQQIISSGDVIRMDVSDLLDSEMISYALSYVTRDSSAAHMPPGCLPKHLAPYAGQHVGMQSRAANFYDKKFVSVAARL
jgi:hypothetical protein